METQPAISIKNVSKSFKLPHEKHTSVKGVLINLLKVGRRTFEKQEVLKNVSLDIKKGEFFGIVGRNGSGKSTLLKLLAGVYSPDKGSITINGKLTPFIELGVGFNPELTGRENVFLNGALLGFSRSEMQEMYDEIVSFAELEKFMDQKLKNYSSGMQVRLAFSIAIRAESDILLLDEVLAVGDINFQRKCFEYFTKLKNGNKTVVFVSHDMSSVEKYCDRAALFVDSRLIDIDKPSVIASHYNKIMIQDLKKNSLKVQKNTKTKKLSPSGEERWGNEEVTIQTVLADQISDNQIKISVTFIANTDINRPVIGFSVKNAMFGQLFGTNTDRENLNLSKLRKNKIYRYHWLINNILNEGLYYIDCTIANNEASNVCDRWPEATSITVTRNQQNPYPMMANDIDFSLKEVSK